MDRVDYSNDTATVVKGPLPLEDTNMQQQVINHLVTMLVVEPPTKSSIDRLDYASDTTTGLIRGPLTATNQYLQQPVMPTLVTLLVVIPVYQK